jgi:hypothetical protein
MRGAFHLLPLIFMKLMFSIETVQKMFQARDVFRKANLGNSSHHHCCIQNNSGVNRVCFLVGTTGDCAPE